MQSQRANTRTAIENAAISTSTRDINPNLAAMMRAKLGRSKIPYIEDQRDGRTREQLLKWLANARDKHEVAAIICRIRTNQLLNK